MPDTMTKQLEGWLQGLFNAAPDLDDVKAIIAGEPFVVPVKLHPFLTVFVGERREAEERGYGEETGPVVGYAYPGYVSIETLLNDAPALKVGPAGPTSRLMVIPSHDLCDRLTWAVWEAMKGAMDPHQVIEGTVVSYDDKERTQELALGSMRFGLQQRPDSVTNTGTVEFTIYSRREEF